MDVPAQFVDSSSSPAPMGELELEERPTGNELPIWERCQIKDVSILELSPFS